MESVYNNDVFYVIRVLCLTLVSQGTYRHYMHGFCSFCILLNTFGSMVQSKECCNHFNSLSLSYWHMSMIQSIYCNYSYLNIFVEVVQPSKYYTLKQEFIGASPTLARVSLDRHFTSLNNKNEHDTL